MKLSCQKLACHKFTVGVIGLVLVHCVLASAVGVAQDIFLGLEDSGDIEEAKTLLAEGKGHLENEEYDEAIAVLNKAIRLNDKYAEAQLVLGQVYEQMENFEKAYQAFNKAIVDGEDVLSEADLAVAYNGRGEAAVSVGEENNESSLFFSAIQDFDAAVAREWRNKDYLFNLGSAYSKVGNADLAISALDRALALDPDLAEAYDARGQAYALQATQDPAILEKSVEDFFKAMSLEPDNEKFPQNLAMVFFQEEKYIDAIKAFTAAIAKDSKQEYFEPWLGRSLSLIEIGKRFDSEVHREKFFRAAIADAQTAFSMEPELVVALLAQGVAFRFLEEYEPAIAAFTEAVRLQPEFSEALFRRGIVWYYLGEYELALTDFEEAIAFNPSDPRAYVWQGFTYIKQEKYYDAIGAYSLALEQMERYVPSLNNRGLAYLHVGRYDKAISDFNELIRLQPDNAVNYFKRGVAQFQQGDLEMAATSLRLATRFDLNYQAAYAQLAKVHERLGQGELARGYRQQAEAAAWHNEQGLSKGAEKKSELPPPVSMTLGSPPSNGQVKEGRSTEQPIGESASDANGTKTETPVVPRVESSDSVPEAGTNLDELFNPFGGDQFPQEPSGFDGEELIP